MISRDSYLEKLIEYDNPRLIKIITGIRRSGKSTILQMYREHILQTKPHMKVLHLNLESFENYHLKTADDLANRVTQELGTMDHDKEYTVLLDEVQLIPGWSEWSMACMPPLW